jgi:hypothetical protein
MGLGLEIIDAMKIYHPTISLLTALATGCATSSPTKLTTIQNDSVPPLERRLLELGYNEQQINEQLSTLSEDELEYFNKHPEEIKKIRYNHSRRPNMVICLFVKSKKETKTT